MGVQPQVVLHQGPEGVRPARAEADVDVHAAAPEQSRVHIVPVVGGEDDDPLLSAAGPKPVGEVQEPRERHPPALLLVVVVGLLRRRRLRSPPRLRRRSVRRQIHGAVYILDHDDGPVRRLYEQSPELRVVRDFGQLQVVDVVAEVVSHSGDQARLPRTRRSVQKVATLPCAANPVVELLASGERRQVLRYLLLHLGLQGQRVKRGRVTERDGGPAGLVGAVAVVGEEPPLSGHSLELLGTGDDVVEVGGKDEVAVALGELEDEATALVEGVLDGVDLVGPREGVAEEGVVDGVVGCDGEGDALGGLGARQG